MYDIFICYAKEDREIAQKLHLDLKQNGYNPWIDTKDIKPGQKWEVAIDKAISESTYFAALMSKVSLDKEGYVQVELRKALSVLQRKPADRVFLIPVRLDDCNPQNEELRKIHWLDLFPYEKGLNRLITSIARKGGSVGGCGTIKISDVSLMIDSLGVPSADLSGGDLKRRIDTILRIEKAVEFEKDLQGFVVDSLTLYIRRGATEEFAASLEKRRVIWPSPDILTALAVIGRFPRGVGWDPRDLRGIYLSSVDLKRAPYGNVDFSGAMLAGADFSYAALKGGRFRRAQLKNSIFAYAEMEDVDLTEADLRDADLKGAILSNAKLVGANLAGAELKSANVDGADISRATGLEQATLDELQGNEETVIPGDYAKPLHWLG